MTGCYAQISLREMQPALSVNVCATHMQSFYDILPDLTMYISPAAVLADIISLRGFFKKKLKIGELVLLASVLKTIAVVESIIFWISIIHKPGMIGMDCLGIRLYTALTLFISLLIMSTMGARKSHGSCCCWYLWRPMYGDQKDLSNPLASSTIIRTVPTSRLICKNQTG